MLETKILLIEDDPAIVENLSAFLKEEGFEVISVNGQQKALEQLEICRPQLILLDVTLAEGNGYSACTAIKAKYEIPIIFLTALGDEFSVVTGLDMGADDYITKPFHIAVLESRIRAVLRRAGKTDVSGSGESHPELFTCGMIQMDKKKMRVTAEGKEILLTNLEYRLLQMLMENKGCILPRSLILERLWDDEGNFVNDNTLTVAVKRLREKLGKPSCIATVRGIGYRMEETV